VADAAAAAAEAHLRRVDPILGALIDRFHPLPDRVPGADPYGALVRAIVGQQLSTTAARAIHGRLLESFGGHDPTPAQLLAADPDAMRTAAGLSRAKVVFLRSLAEKVESGELRLDRLHELDDEQVMAQLTAVKGVGTWTAHVFLMFQLGRPDVLPVGDLGIRRAVERAYGLEDLPGTDQLTALAEPWRPYRSLASRYLWRSLENEPDVAA
jgi:DNA-3-methyladenine glycosylase II